MIKFKIEPYTKNGKFRKPRLIYGRSTIVEDNRPYKKIGKLYEIVCGWFVLSLYWGKKY